LISACGAAEGGGEFGEELGQSSQAVVVSCDGAPAWQLHTTYAPLAHVQWQGALYECVNDWAKSGWCGQYQPDGLHAEDAWTKLRDCGACQALINEVQPRGPVSHDDEWVELTSSCSGALSLDGLKLIYRSMNGTTDVLMVDLAGKTIPAGGYLLFTGSQYAGTATSDGRLKSAMTAQPLGGAGLAIVRPGLNGAPQQVIDAVGYGASANMYHEGPNAPMPAIGSSFARIPNKRDTNNNQTDFAVRTPSPRQANP
jgi:hypothetical protein